MGNIHNASWYSSLSSDEYYKPYKCNTIKTYIKGKLTIYFDSYKILYELTENDIIMSGLSATIKKQLESTVKQKLLQKS